MTKYLKLIKHAGWLWILAIFCLVLIAAMQYFLFPMKLNSVDSFLKYWVHHYVIARVALFLFMEISWRVNKKKDFKYVRGICISLLGMCVLVVGQILLGRISDVHIPVFAILAMSSFLWLHRKEFISLAE